jgi:hypothetical protein
MIAPDEFDRTGSNDHPIEKIFDRIGAFGHGGSANPDSLFERGFHKRPNLCGWDTRKAGASHAEIIEALSVAVMMGGGPASMYACEALDALQQYESKSSAS